MKYFYLPGICLLAGCSSTWVPVSQNTAYTAQEADVFCRKEAWAVFPVKNEIATETEWKMPDLICKERGDKEKTKAQRCYADPTAGPLQNVKTHSYVVDVNEKSRRDYHADCMKEKGWKKITRFGW